jgi:hypothetical protein
MPVADQWQRRRSRSRRRRGIARSFARQLRFEFLNPHEFGGCGQEHALVVEMPLPEPVERFQLRDR